MELAEYQAEKANYLDRVDVRIAGCISLIVILWAFLCSFPCPHPDQWQRFAEAALLRPAGSMLDAVWLFVANALFGMFGIMRGVTALGIAGKIALGLTGGFAYLVLRAFWFERLNPEEPEIPTGFWDTRFGSAAGATIMCVSAYAWREAQFLSADFLALFLSAVTLFLWIHSRHSHNLGVIAVAYALGGMVAMASPLALVMLIVMFACDERTRYMKQFLELKEDEGQVLMLADSKETVTSLLALFAGAALGIAICIGGAYRFSIAPDVKFWGFFGVWFSTWCHTFGDRVLAPGVLTLVGFVVMVVVAISAGRRMRMMIGGAKALRNVFLAVFMVTALVLFCRRATGIDRLKLDALRQYATLVADSCRDVGWLFTDGAFDDIFRLTMKGKGVPTAVMSLMNSPTEAESAAFRRYAPEALDRGMFAAGGSEVFKYWAQERKDRLGQSAWLLGSQTVRKYDPKAPIFVRGGVVRHGDPAKVEDKLAVERRAADIVKTVGLVASRAVSFFAYSDDEISAKFDALLWRLARLADERAIVYSSAENMAAVRKERELVRFLDHMNTTLREGGERIEKLLPTENVVLTPQEGLDVALKRADFDLAMRYARAVLAANPDSASAHFALGMADLEIKEYRSAAKHFEGALKVHPNEPASLNNLAIAYMRMGRFGEAVATAEKALKLHPKSDEVKLTLAEARKKAEEK